jgi:hypothetical protein
MTRLFVQTLLSVIVGISAALSISPKVQADLKENLSQAGASLQETAKVALDNAKIRFNVSLKTNAELSPASGERLELKSDNKVNAKLGNADSILHNLLPGVSVNNTVNNELRTDLEVEPSGLDVELREKDASVFDFLLGPGK